MVTPMPLTLHRPDLLRSTHYIAGHWCEAVGGARFDVDDPALAQAFASVPDGDAGDAAAALDAAHAAFPAWRAVPARERSRILARWNALVLQHKEDLGRLISREQGKPLFKGAEPIIFGAVMIAALGAAYALFSGMLTL